MRVYVCVRKFIVFKSQQRKRRCKQRTADGVIPDSWNLVLLSRFSRAADCSSVNAHRQQAVDMPREPL